MEFWEYLPPWIFFRFPVATLLVGVLFIPVSFVLWKKKEAAKGERRRKLLTAYSLSKAICVILVTSAIGVLIGTNLPRFPR